MGNIHKVLLGLQRKIENPAKNATNPFLKNKYADLGAVIEVIKKSANDLGVLITQDCFIKSGEHCTMSVQTTFTLVEDGSHIVFNTDVVLKELSPQGSMGALTYGRRYGLLAAFCLVSEDDDGNVASGKDGKLDEKILNQEPATTPSQAAKNISSFLSKKK